VNLNFYPRFALSGIMKNRRLYIPFLLVSILNSSMFYMLSSLLYHPDLMKNRGAESLKVMLAFGTWIIIIFSAIFLFYANSFLIKQRSNEIGLYSVLGMGKRNVAGVLFCEFLMTSTVSVGAGIGIGVLLSRLVYAILGRLVDFDLIFHFQVSGEAAGRTAIAFFAILFASFILHLFRVTVSRPIELVRGTSTGEKEPKTKWILALIGVVTLGGGFFIANTQDKPLAALQVFFIAVVLVMVGTYCLFTAGSIVVLKAMRKNKNYYYRPENFTSISGLLYRMKQNGIGLASISILSTMALLTIVTTVTMYISSDEALDARYPNDVNISVQGVDAARTDAFQETVMQMAADRVLAVENLSSVTYITMPAQRDGSQFNLTMPEEGFNMTLANLMSDFEYRKAVGSDLELAPGTVVVFANKPCDEKTISLGSVSLNVVTTTDPEPVDQMLDIVDSYTFIIAASEFDQVLAANQILPAETSYHLYFDVTGDEAKTVDLGSALRGILVESPVEGFYLNADARNYMVEIKSESEFSFRSMYGGLLFLGVFLGFVFLLGTVLIIYFKQISEGYGDHRRFEIMRKVGMNDAEIKKTIRRQILLVFFLPLITTFVHMAFAFRFMTQIMNVMYFNNTTLFAWCTIVCAVIFAIAYAIVYTQTARVYYRIVR